MNNRNTLMSQWAVPNHKSILLCEVKKREKFKFSFYPYCLSFQACQKNSILAFTKDGESEICETAGRRNKDHLRRSVSEAVTDHRGVKRKIRITIDVGANDIPFGQGVPYCVIIPPNFYK